MICAICTAAILGAAFTREPLGRNDALVVVCLSCSSGPVIADDGPDRGWEPSGGLPTFKEGGRIPLLGAADEFDAAAPFFARTEGSRLVRLHITRFGRTRDAAEAVIEDIPSIAADVRYLGAVNAKALHVYETFVSLDAVQGARQSADRDRRKKLGRCINSDDHGAATHGVLCLGCRQTHRAPHRKSA